MIVEKHTLEWLEKSNILSEKLKLLFLKIIIVCLDIFWHLCTENQNVISKIKVHKKRVP